MRKLTMKIIKRKRGSILYFFMKTFFGGVGGQDSDPIPCIFYALLLAAELSSQ